MGVGGRWGMSWDDAELWLRWLWVNGNVDGPSRTLAAFLARDLPSPPPPPDPYHSNDVANNRYLKDDVAEVVPKGCGHVII